MFSLRTIPLLLASAVISSALAAPQPMRIGEQRISFVPPANSRSLDSCAKSIGLQEIPLEADLTRDGIVDRLVRLFVVDSQRILREEDVKFGPEALLFYQGFADGRDSLVWASDAAFPWRSNCGCSYLHCTATIWTKNHTVQLEVSGSSNQSSQSETVQYRFEKGEFVAIGIQFREMQEDNDGTYLETSTDHNLLTGNFNDTIENANTGKRTVKKSRKAKTSRPILRDRYRECVESLPAE